MIPVRVELATVCRYCDGLVTIGAVTPAAACVRCAREVALDAAVWHQLLYQIVADTPSLPAYDERDGHADTAAGTIRRFYRRTEPTCLACGTAASMEPLIAAARAGANSIRCRGCGADRSLRALPEIPGVALVFGEAAASGSKAQREALQYLCPHCGGPLPPGAAGTHVECAYCRTGSELPNADDPSAARAGHPFWILVDAEPRPESLVVHWGKLRDARSDHAGNVYVLGEDGSAIFAFDPELRLRWIKRSFGVTGNLLAVAGRTLVVYAPGGGAMLGADDGTVLRLPPGLARALGGASTSGPGTDGNVLLITYQGGVERVALDGTGRPTFSAPAEWEPPPRAGFFSRLFGGDVPALADLAPAALNAGDHPTGALICGTPDGGLVITRVLDPDGDMVESYDAAGSGRWSTSLGAEGLPEWITVDPHGACWWVKDFRIGRADARGSVVVLRGERAGRFFPSRDAPRLIPLPTGELWVFQHDDVVRRVTPEFAILWSSPAALAVDERSRSAT